MCRPPGTEYESGENSPTNLKLLERYMLRLADFDNKNSVYNRLTVQ